MTSGNGLYIKVCPLSMVSDFAEYQPFSAPGEGAINVLNSVKLAGGRQCAIQSGMRIVGDR